MNTLLWVLQWLLAAAFLAHAGLHLAPPEALRAEMAEQAIPRARMTANLAEIAGALGLVLPGLTGIAPWLTPLAAAGLALVMAGAVAFHVRRREWDAVAFAAVFLVLTAFVAVGRAWIEPLG